MLQPLRLGGQEDPVGRERDVQVGHEVDLAWGLVGFRIDVEQEDYRSSVNPSHAADQKPPEAGSVIPLPDRLDLDRLAVARAGRGFRRRQNTIERLIGNLCLVEDSIRVAAFHQVPEHLGLSRLMFEIPALVDVVLPHSPSIPQGMSGRLAWALWDVRAAVHVLGGHGDQLGSAGAAA